MIQYRKSTKGAWSDFGAGVAAWALGIAFLGGGIWLMLGGPDLSKLFDGGNDSTTSGLSQTLDPQSVNEDYEPSDQEIQQAEQESWEKITGEKWSCSYDPSMNDNWHDDVLCTTGPNSHRPILLPDQGFVTEAEMQAAGQEYEDYLNAGGSPQG